MEPPPTGEGRAPRRGRCSARAKRAASRSDDRLRGEGAAPHRIPQDELTRAVSAHWSGGGFGEERLRGLHRATRVQARTFALPLEAYGELASFAEANRIWTRLAVELGAAALERALDEAALDPGAVDHLFFVSSTGLATPSVDARIANRLHLRADAKRSPFFGLGCAGGAAGLGRAADWLGAFPGKTAALVAVELCSLTWQRGDVSVGNAIAAGLFGDGAAAVVLRSGAGAGPRVLATRSVLFADTEGVMGWEVVESGLRVNLSAKVPAVVRAHIRREVDAFLEAEGLDRGAIEHWICHPGGPRVIEAIEEELELAPAQTARTWRTLEALGNLSSVSVLLVLEATLREARPREGALGLLLAMGPGFCCELVLLRWEGR